MQKLFSIRGNLTIAMLTLLLGACASERPVAITPVAPALSGDQMLRESEGIAHLSSRWKSGKQMIERGNAMVREGQAKIDEGNRMINDGTTIVRESEESYRNIKN